MKPSWYADVTESCLTYSLGEANERRGLELRHHSQCFMKLLSSQLFKITTPQIFAICWFKISGFTICKAPQSLWYLEICLFSWEFHHLGGWRAEASHQARSECSMPPRMSAYPCSFALLLFIIIQEVEDSWDFRMHPSRTSRAHYGLDQLGPLTLGSSSSLTPWRTEWREKHLVCQQCSFIQSTSLYRDLQCARLSVRC